MPRFGRLPKMLAVFWIGQIMIIGVLWGFLPNHLTSTLLLLLAAANAVLLALRQFDLPIFSNVALVLALAHFWMSNGNVTPLVASLLIFIGISLTGLIAQAAKGPLGRDEILVWVIVGLFTAQMASLIQYWPISYFQKSMLGTVVFYSIWQLWQVIETDRKLIWSHFIFVGLAVIVVIGNIVWTTWPGLKTF